MRKSARQRHALSPYVVFTPPLARQAPTKPRASAKRATKKKRAPIVGSHARAVKRNDATHALAAHSQMAISQVKGGPARACTHEEPCLIRRKGILSGDDDDDGHVLSAGEVGFNDMFQYRDRTCSMTPRDHLARKSSVIQSPHGHDSGAAAIVALIHGQGKP